MSKIRDLRVLITGASSGIGKALAFEFANKGARLTIASRSFDSLKKVADELEDAFPGIQAPLAVACDVSNRENVNQLIKRCEDHWGSIDILINNAGTGVYGYSEMTALEDFRSVMEVNFFGAVHCILSALPLLKKNGRGLIVNISSVAAVYGVPYLGAYSASKAALVTLGQSLRAELGGNGVSIMNVYPGYTQTGFFKKEKKVGGAHRPPGPYVSPQRVAKAIVRAIKKEKQELVLSLGGKMLALSRSFLPWLVKRAMKRIADKLRDKKEEFNE